MDNYFSYQQHEFSGKPVHKLSMAEAGTPVLIEHCSSATSVICRYLYTAKSSSNS